MIAIEQLTARLRASRSSKFGFVSADDNLASVVKVDSCLIEISYCRLTGKKYTKAPDAPICLHGGGTVEGTDPSTEGDPAITALAPVVSRIFNAFACCSEPDSQKSTAG